METTITRQHVARQLEELAVQAEECRSCPLGSARTQAVFSRGTPDAEVMFIGEAPGFHEDKRGEPFVGAAGQLLDRLIETKMRMSPGRVYVANVLKCRPPGNRDPLPVEIEACRPFLERQIDLVSPKVIVALGNFAAKLLLDTQTGITRLRGRRFSFRGATLIPTFHPAAALRGTSAANGIAEDFEQVRALLDEMAAAAPDDSGPEDPDTEQLGLF